MAVLLSTALAGAAAAQAGCEARPVRVDGHSLAPPVADGAQIMMRPVDCAGEIRAGDLVVFTTGAHQRPVIKTVRALPRDRFGIADGYILVNGAKMRTGTGEYYRLRGGRDRLLRLYADSFGGAVPADAYLVLGERPGSGRVTGTW